MDARISQSLLKAATGSPSGMYSAVMYRRDGFRILVDIAVVHSPVRIVASGIVGNVEHARRATA